MSGQRLGPRQFYANILEGSRLFYWMNTSVIPNAQLELELQRALDLDYDFIKTGISTVPLEHHEFGLVVQTDLRVPETGFKFKDPRQALDQHLF